MKLSSILQALALLPAVLALPGGQLEAAPNPSTVPPFVCLVSNTPIGTVKNDWYSLYPDTPGQNVQKVQTWTVYNSQYQGKIVTGLQITWAGGQQSPVAGRAVGGGQTFEFQDGEKIKTMEVKAGDAVNSIKITTTQSRTFFSGGGGGGGSSLNVGNGVLSGIYGKHNSAGLYSVGPTFYKDC